MPRILRIINRLNLGGPTYNAALLSKYLAPEFETCLVAGEKQDSEESSDFIVKDLGLTYRQVPEMRRELNFTDDRKAYLHLRQMIREWKPDIVHTHAAKPGTLGRLAAIHEKVPVIVHTFHGHVFHSYFGPVKTRFFLEIERYLARKSSAIIAISEKQKSELVHTYRVCKEEKAHVIPLGFNLTRFSEATDTKRREFRELYGVADDEVAIGIIGRLVPVKNHTFFLDCIRKIMDPSARIRVFIIGDGEERARLLEYSRSIQLETAYFPENKQPAQVVFTSWIKEVDVAVAGLDIVALTSLNEGTPVSLIEAQAGSKPVLSTNVGGVEDVILPGRTGLLCASNDSDCFTANLRRLIQSPATRMELGGNGLEHVRNKYHYTRLVSDTKKLYFDLLK